MSALNPAQAGLAALACAACAPTPSADEAPRPRSEPIRPIPGPARSPDFQPGDPSTEREPPQRPDDDPSG